MIIPLVPNALIDELWKLGGQTIRLSVAGNELFYVHATVTPTDDYSIELIRIWQPDK